MVAETERKRKQNEQQVLVWCFFSDVFFNTSTSCSEGIACVENVYHHVGGTGSLAIVSSPASAPCTESKGRSF
ncbi:hypothetical protein KC363_g216 [Hortaea werneckii]|nr:hypothetical protein KC363_g216 [Hortaea werneckii]